MTNAIINWLEMYKKLAGILTLTLPKFGQENLLSLHFDLSGNKIGFNHTI